MHLHLGGRHSDTLVFLVQYADVVVLMETNSHVHFRTTPKGRNIVALVQAWFLNLERDMAEAARVAARIIGTLDDRGLTVQAAQEMTGVAAADFSRIRRARLDRFTIDRLMSILSGLGQRVEVTVDVRPRQPERV